MHGGGRSGKDEEVKRSRRGGEAERGGEESKKLDEGGCGEGAGLICSIRDGRVVDETAIELVRVQ
jgi:hypothetical protein